MQRLLRSCHPCCTKEEMTPMTFITIRPQVSFESSNRIHLSHLNTDMRPVCPFLWMSDPQKAFSASGASRPDEGLCPWTPLGAPPQIPVIGLRSTLSKFRVPPLFFFKFTPVVAHKDCELDNKIAVHKVHGVSLTGQMWTLICTALELLQHLFFLLLFFFQRDKNEASNNEINVQSKASRPSGNQLNLPHGNKTKPEMLTYQKFLFFVFLARVKTYSHTKN